MKIVVAVKQVPDVSSVQTDDSGNIVREGIPSVLNPYCEYAVYMACRLKGDGPVTAVTMGPPQARGALLRCLELGADEAYLISDKAFAGSDAFATSKVLSAFVRTHIPGYDLILCGKQASDGDTAEVPAELACMLGVQQFCYVDEIVAGDDLRVLQNYRDEKRICVVPLRSVISVSKGECNRRLPSINDYLRAADVEIKTLDKAALGLDEQSAGVKGSKTRIISSRSSGVERSCVTIDGTNPSDAADVIIKEAGM
ncbi:MAG: electron transfer flavoprotein subunit beta/FixA family protein [Candidatus Methanoplasma sp.]|jgi:electron transfer flavoprotein beta subunit|nr:electron transfer flavoprotein subunit beta/FixA family protein [Candidatus Methanoplasma sp.]